MDYEQLGVFYLGKRYDIDNAEVSDELVLYESRDLLTHAVCVGMTGSGKTGLCIDLLEEAAIDNIPVIAIDPKGDLSNLLLTFPEMDANAFKDWVDPDEARRTNTSVEELAEKEASKWRSGLEEWHQDLERVKRLKNSAKFAVYTPAATSGIPLSIMRSFDCPDKQILEERDLLREQISSTATSILALLGIEADPLKSKEHILLCAILDQTWKQGANLDLHALITKVQTPPITQLGAIPLESFFPAKERYEFAMAINNILASPGFEAWTEGEPLDIDSMFYTESGKNKVSIISISHLPDSERMFFVSLLLTQLLSWTRRQSGTSSLRAIFYMDEIFGYLPPVANPPSKTPLLTLLKQARAFGLGLVLATQNPVDLDYKALGNAGTWFVGRLQTERDKLRLLEGLESVATNAGTGFDREEADRLISSLSKQVFLVNNIHDNAPFLMKTRHAMSYLRGPLSRTQLKSLTKTFVSSGSAEPNAANKQDKSQTVEPATTKVAAPTPLLPPEIKQKFAPRAATLAPGAKLVYKPMIFASVQLTYVDSKVKINTTETLNLLTLIKSETRTVKWEKSFATKFGGDDLKDEGEAGMELSPLPAEAADPRIYKQWTNELISWLMSNKSLKLLKCPISGQYSHPHESERDFRLRIAQDSREKRDQMIAALSKKYSEKLAAVHDDLELAEMNLSNKVSQARTAEMEAAVNVGSSIFEAFVGRKVMSQSNIRRASSAARKAGQAQLRRAQVGYAEQTRDSLEAKVEAIQAEFDAEMKALKDKIDPDRQELVKVSVSLKKSNISVPKFCLCWAPCIRQPDGRVTVGW